MLKYAYADANSRHADQPPVTILPTNLWQEREIRAFSDFILAPKVYL